MAGAIYRKPVSFAIMAAVTVAIGSLVTMAYPMLRPEMHPKLAALRPYTPLELAGRDLYQREGCVNCHTQTVRPLRSEVLRYGDWSKAGEFYYDRPFLWGSKRTGPDLAREGGRRSDDWHVRHFKDPKKVVPRSTMPAYAFLAEAKLDPEKVRRNYRAFASAYAKGEFAATDKDFAALAGKTEMDAMVAYMQWLGHAVPRVCRVEDPTAASPLPRTPELLKRGAAVWEAANCASCHGDDLGGLPGAVPGLLDDDFLGAKGDPPDGTYFGLILCGSDAKKELGRPGLPDGGMTPYQGQLDDEDVWAVISFIRAKQGR